MKRVNKTWLWIILGAIFLYGCSAKEDTSELSQPEEDKTETGREILQEGPRKPGEGVLMGEGYSKQRMFLKRGPLKEDLEKIREEARELGAGDSGDYRLETQKERLKERALSIIEKSGDQLSEEEVNRLVGRYVQMPFVTARAKKEIEDKFEKGLADLGQEVTELLQREMDWAERKKEKKRLRAKLYEILEDKMGEHMSEQYVDEYFEEYVEKPFKGAKK